MAKSPVADGHRNGPDAVDAVDPVGVGEGVVVVSVVVDGVVVVDVVVDWVVVVVGVVVVEPKGHLNELKSN